MSLTKDGLFPFAEHVKVPEKMQYWDSMKRNANINRPDPGLPRGM